MNWLIIIIIGVLTFTTRLSYISIFGNRDMPAPLQRALRFVPAAVLSAIILPAIFLTDGHINVALTNFRMFAGILAAVTIWRTHNIVLTLIIGMGSLWLLNYLFR